MDNGKVKHSQNDVYVRHEDVGFVSPQCGSHHYHTVGANHWATAVGHCHDQLGKGCKFTWNRAKQDKDVRKARCECPKHANSESR